MGGFNAPTPVRKMMIVSPGSAGLASVISLKSAWAMANAGLSQTPLTSTDKIIAFRRQGV